MYWSPLQLQTPTHSQSTTHRPHPLTVLADDEGGEVGKFWDGRGDKKDVILTDVQLL